MMLDTTVLVRMFTDSGTPREVDRILGDEDAYASIVQLAEIAGWAVRERRPVRERIEGVKELVAVLPLGEEECRDAASIRDERRKAGVHGFGIIDGLILATARVRGERVLTFDRHFEGEDDCIVLR